MVVQAALKMNLKMMVMMIMENENNVGDVAPDDGSILWRFIFYCASLRTLCLVSFCLRRA